MPQGWLKELLSLIPFSITSSYSSSFSFLSSFFFSFFFFCLKSSICKCKCHPYIHTRRAMWEQLAYSLTCAQINAQMQCHWFRFRSVWDNNETMKQSLCLQNSQSIWRMTDWGGDLSWVSWKLNISQRCNRCSLWTLASVRNCWIVPHKSCVR